MTILNGNGNGNGRFLRYLSIIIPMLMGFGGGAAYIASWQGQIVKNAQTIADNQEENRRIFAQLEKEIASFIAHVETWQAKEETYDKEVRDTFRGEQQNTSDALRAMNNRYSTLINALIAGKCLAAPPSAP